MRRTAARRAGAVEHELDARGRLGIVRGVEPCAAVDRVAAGAARQHVVVRAAVEEVGARTALQRVGALAPEQFLGRGTAAVLLAAFLVASLLYVTADLDRPTRGIINVPDTVLVRLQEKMERPPAAGPPPGQERAAESP